MQALMRIPLIWWAIGMDTSAYILAVIGLSPAYPATPLGFAALAYHAAGVLAFEEPDTVPQANVAYAYARPFAVAFALLAATRVLEAFGPVRERYLWLRNRFDQTVGGKKLAVVVGLGWIGAPLVEKLQRRRARRPVVAVEVDDESPVVQDARRHGTLVVTGNVTDVATQDRIPFHEASEVFVATGDDARNVEIAGALLEASWRWRRSRTLGPLRCYVHLASAGRQQALSRHGLWAAHGKNIELYAFSQPELAARDLFFHAERGLGMDAALQPVPKSKEPFHLFVFGFGPTGRSVARHLARFGHFGSLVRPRLTVFPLRSDQPFEQFLERHPGFAPPHLDLANEAFEHIEADDWDVRHGRPVSERYRFDPATHAVEYAVNAESIPLTHDIQSEAVTGAILKRLQRSAGRRVRAAIVVCFEEDRLSFESALNLQHALFHHAAEAGYTDGPIPIYIYLPVEHGLASVIDRRRLEGEATATPAKRFPMRPFGRRDEVTSYERITRPDLAMHARGARQVYKRIEPFEGAVSHPDFVMSNLDAAQHAVVKLAALGIELTEPGKLPPEGAVRVLPELLSDDIDEQITRLSRHRIDAERFLTLAPRVQQRIALMNAVAGPNESAAEAVQAAIDAAVDDFEAGLLAARRDPQLVAQMEHHRWMGERLTAGWRYGKRSNVLRTRPSMVPWVYLDSHNQRHDRIDLVRFLVQEWAWGRTSYFGDDPATEGSMRTTGHSRRSA